MSGKPPRRAWEKSPGRGWEWTLTAKRIHARDKGLCQPCKRAGLRGRIGRVVDHIKPRAEGGTDDDRNLELICDDCNDFKTYNRTIPRGCDVHGNPLLCGLALAKGVPGVG